MFSVWKRIISIFLLFRSLEEDQTSNGKLLSILNSVTAWWTASPDRVIKDMGRRKARQTDWKPAQALEETSVSKKNKVIIWKEGGTAKVFFPQREAPCLP